MIREYRDDANVLEYLESFSSSIARMVENTTVVNWSDLAGICDQRYYSMKNGNPVDLNAELLNKCEDSVKAFLSE
jgi:hypothetical protein